MKKIFLVIKKIIKKYQEKKKIEKLLKSEDPFIYK